jgi:hypothetical protein
MQENKLQTEHVTKPERFFELMTSGKYHVTDYNQFSDEIMQVQFRMEDAFIEPNPGNSVVHAA